MLLRLTGLQEGLFAADDDDVAYDQQVLDYLDVVSIYCDDLVVHTQWCDGDTKGVFGSPVQLRITISPHTCCP
jgi:hypothetical protein